MGAYPGHNVSKGGSNSGSGSGGAKNNLGKGSVTTINSTIGPDGKTVYSTQVMDKRSGLSTYYQGFGMSYERVIKQLLRRGRNG